MKKRVLWAVALFSLLAATGFARTPAVFAEGAVRKELHCEAGERCRCRPGQCEDGPCDEDCGKDGARHGKKGGPFSGEFYEKNKDKTLAQIREEWLEKLKSKLDEAVASGQLSRREAEEIYKNAQEGKPVRVREKNGVHRGE